MALRIYYTGTSQHQETQPLPSQSLGGRVSSTPIQQDVNSLFPDIGVHLTKKPSHILIALYNDSGTNVSGTVSCDSESSYFDYQLACVLPTIDSCGKPVFEHLSTSSNKPIYALFQETDVFEIPANSYCGVWIQRKIKQEIDIDNPNFFSDDSLTVETQTITSFEEVLALVIDF